MGRWTFDESELRLRLPEMAAGAYLLRIEDGTGIETQKLVVR